MKWTFNFARKRLITLQYTQVHVFAMRSAAIASLQYI